jgi:hypothetical protein
LSCVEGCIFEMEPLLENGRDDFVAMGSLIWQYLVEIPSDFTIACLPYAENLNEVPYGTDSLGVILFEPFDFKDRVGDLLL